MDERDVVRVDSTKLRALAHPLRSRLLGALRTYGPATATALAQRLGTNSGATSYHLRQLAEAGLVEDDPGQGDSRERWWRAAHAMTSWRETELLEDPDNLAAVDWLRGHHLRTTTRWLEDWLESRHEWSAEWLDASSSSDYSLTLTAARARALSEELSDVVERYRAEESTEDDAQRVMVVFHVFPSPEPRL